MVLEGYLSRVLVDRFGRYVKGMDADNLRLSVWKGEVLLKGLQLKTDALTEELELPVDVKWGHIGLFHLSVPWSKLGSKPVRVTLEDVYILLSPLDTCGMDDMERQRRARYQKSRGVERRLQKYLERKASLAQNRGGGEGAAGERKGVWGRLVAKVVDNIQITVKHIHLRYEDEISFDGGGGGVHRPLSAGVTLQKLVVQTVDENWRLTYVRRGDTETSKGVVDSGDFVHKLVTVDSLAVYCDGPTTSGESSSPRPSSSTVRDTEEADKSTLPPCFLAHGRTDADLVGMFRSSLRGDGSDQRDSGGGDHSYVVMPISPSFRLRMQKGSSAGGDGGGGGDGDAARFKVQAIFNEVGVVLNNAQIADINKMRSTLRDLERWEALYRHRPKHSIKDGPKAWWIFLFKCVSRPGKATQRPKLGWLDVVRLLRLRRTYVALYIARARHQATPEEYQQFTRLDEQLTANEIVAFRLKAIAELEEDALQLQSAPTVLPQQHRKRTWGEWLLRRDPSSNASSATTDAGYSATPTDAQGEDAAARQEFLDAFAPDADVDREEEVDPDRVLWDVEASLNDGALTLINGKTPCLRIIFDVMAMLKKKKTDWKLDLGLGALQAFGLGQEGGRATTLLTRRTWRPHDVAASSADDMIQIGDFQVWKSGGVTVEYRKDRDDAGNSPMEDREDLSGQAGGDPSTQYFRGIISSSVVSVRVVLAPHQVLHSRVCMEQVSSMLGTRDMQMLTSAAQSRISRLQTATRSSFLHAIGSSQRLEVTADIHAPLLVIPDNTNNAKERASLLVLDLGHISFRRDDEANQSGSRIQDLEEAPSADRSPACFSKAGGGRLGEEGVGLAVDDWRLGISGVQVVVADSVSFFGETSSHEGARAAQAHTAIVEQFDLFVKIRTVKDTSTDQLLGVCLEAKLPRLSFNLHSSAYQLLLRLLKHELKRSASGVVASTASTSTSTTSPTQRRHLLAATGTTASSISPSAATDARDRRLATVLSTELEPVTEIPGETDLGFDSADLDSVVSGNAGVRGGCTTPRRRNSAGGSQRHRRRPSTPDSCNPYGIISQERFDEGVEGKGTHAGGAGRDAEQDDESYSEFDRQTAAAVGLTVEVRICAPAISVLLVHDVGSMHSSGSGGSISAKGEQSGLEEHGVRDAKAEADGLADVGGSRRDDIDVKTQTEEGGHRGAAEGALALVEIHGLGVEYQRCSGGEDLKEEKDTLLQSAPGQPQNQTPQFVLKVVSFHVEDMYQQAGDEFSWMLSSKPPPSGLSAVPQPESVGDTDKQAGSVAGTEPVPAAAATGPDGPEAVRVTHVIPDPGTVGPVKTIVSLSGVWANWNPETIAALSIFAHGLYGMRGEQRLDSGGGGGGREDVTSEGARASTVAGATATSPFVATSTPAQVPGAGSSTANAESAADQHDGGFLASVPAAALLASPELPVTEQRRHSAAAMADGRAGARVNSKRDSVIVVEIRRVSLWLNKEIDDRRLLLLKAADSTVEIARTRLPDGESIARYNIALRSASLMDLSTRESKWRLLVSPSLKPDLPIPEVRLSLVKDTRDTEFPLGVQIVLQSCAVAYLNQTWLEAFDYFLHGVLGDGPWRPWLLPLEQLEDVTGTRSSAAAEPCPATHFSKRRLSVEAFDPEVVVPAGHNGEGWVALRVKHLVAANSYDQRSMMADDNGESGELCQVWSVKIDGVELRSSRPTERSAQAPSGADQATDPDKKLGRCLDTYFASGTEIAGGSNLSTDGADIGAITIEARWSMTPRTPRRQASPQDDYRSNYIVAGSAPDLKLTLHGEDYAVLWKVVSQNLAGAAPQRSGTSSPPRKSNASGTLPHQAPRSGRRRRRRQLTLYPYESTPPVAATFDVRFELPDVAVDAVARTNAEEVVGGKPATSGSRSSEKLRQIGSLRSTLVNWRLRRYSDFRLSNEVIVGNPLLTNVVPSEGEVGAARELIGPAPNIQVRSPPIHAAENEASLPEMNLAQKSSAGESAVQGDCGGSTKVSEDERDNSPTMGEEKRRRQEFRWCKRTWKDGGRSNYLSIEGCGLLLSKPRWGAWRRWIGGGDGGAARQDAVHGDDERSEGHSPPQPSSGGIRGASDGHRQRRVKGQEQQRRRDVMPAAGTAADDDDCSREATAAADIPELGSALDVVLAGVTLVLEPWSCRDVGEGDRRSASGDGGDNGGGDVTGEVGPVRRSGEAVAVRAELSFTMTTAFFLRGHWAKGLQAAGSMPTIKLQDDGSFAARSSSSTARGSTEDTRRFPKNTAIIACEVATIEAFSRPLRSNDVQDLSPCSSVDASMAATRADATSGSVWRTVLESASGNVWHCFCPPDMSTSNNNSAALLPTASNPAAKSAEGRRYREEAEARTRGSFRLLYLEGWSHVRAVVRPSDISMVLRTLAEDGSGPTSAGAGSVGNGGGDGSVPASEAGSQIVSDRPLEPDNSAKALRRDDAAAPVRTTAAMAAKSMSPTSVALEIVGSGAGISVQLDDDSGLHFIAPPGMSAAGREKTPASAAERASGKSRVTATTAPSSILRPTPQPVVEVSADSWHFRFARSRLATAQPAAMGGREDGNGAATVDVSSVDAESGATPETRGTDIDFSMTFSTLTVLDLMQRIPCHGTFRKLLFVTAPGSERSDGPDRPTTLPVTPSSFPDCYEKSADSTSASSGSIQFSTNCSSTAVVEYRQTTPTTAERFNSVVVNLGTVAANWNPRTIAAIWSVRAAFGSVLAMKSDEGAAAGVAPALEVGANDAIGRGTDGAEDVAGRSTAERVKLPSSSSEIRVSVRHELEVTFNKEREGRQLLAVSAESLDLSIDSSSRETERDTAVVWQGSVNGLKARDPRHSNVLYSLLVGPVTTGDSPVRLDFRYSKEKEWENSVASAAGVSSPCLESSVLSLSISEARVVYLQPLWLEVIDYLWTGILNTVIWGGGVSAREERARQGIPACSTTIGGNRTVGSSPMTNTADRENYGDIRINSQQAGYTRGSRDNSVDQQGSLDNSTNEHDGGEGVREGRSTSEIRVTLASPTVVLPGALTDPDHIGLRPTSCLRFGTWTGGVDDRAAPPKIEDCSPGLPAARHMIVEALETDIAWGRVSMVQDTDVTTTPSGSPRVDGALSLPEKLLSPSFSSSSTEMDAGRRTDHSVEGDPGIVEADDTGNSGEAFSRGGETTTYYSLLTGPLADITAAITILQPTDMAASPAAATTTFSSGDDDGAAAAAAASPAASTLSPGWAKTWGEDSTEGIEVQREEIRGGGGVSVRRDATTASAPGAGAATASDCTGHEDRGQSAGGGDSGMHGVAAVVKERIMLIRISLPRLQLRMPPGARSALAGGIRKNILAAGFVGNCSENIPLDISSRCAGDYEDHDGDYVPHSTSNAVGMPEARAASSRGASSAPADIALVAGLRKNSAASSNAGSSSLDTAVYAADAAFACESCGQPFEADLVARHRCAWCGDAVCRKCLHTQVSTLVTDLPYPREARTPSRAEMTVNQPSSAPAVCLVCLPCAARTFPEFSVDPTAEVAFRYGDDGLGTAMEVTLEISGIVADLLPPEDPALACDGGHVDSASASRDVRDGKSGLSAEAEGLELSYKRSAKRRGTLDLSVKTVTVRDLEEAAFSRLVAPAPPPVSGAPRPPQVVLSYHLSPSQEAKIQVMVNHLEAIVVPSMVHKITTIFKPCPPSLPPGGDKSAASQETTPTPEVPVRRHSKRRQGECQDAPASPENDHAQTGSSVIGMHDLAALHLAQAGEERGSTTTTDVKVTLLDPVLMLPHDETDPDSTAFFLQGLVMGHYFKSPRHGKSSQSGAGSNDTGAEARDTSLEIIRLESQFGRMFEGTGRASEAQIAGGSLSTRPGVSNLPLGGLRVGGVGAVDPVTLSLHYSEVDRPLHPQVKDMKCQVERLSCQLSYQDMSLFSTIISTWSTGLKAIPDPRGSGGGVGGETQSTTAGFAGQGRGPGAQHAAYEEVYSLAAQSRMLFDDDDDEDDDLDHSEIADGEHHEEYRRFYKVTFETRQLELVLIRQDGVPVVEEVSEYLGLGGKDRGPFVGDEVTAVAGEPISTMEYDQVIQRIRVAPRPLTLVFRRALYETWWGREYSLSLSSWNGCHLDGVFLVAGGAGDQAVIGSADAYRPRRGTGVPANAPQIKPRAGALVVSINSVPVSHLKLSDVSKKLDELEAKKRRDAASRGGENRRGAGGGGGGGSRGGGGGHRKKIRLLMREVETHAWPPNWRNEIQCPGVRVTVIDDREGRDMPLLRVEVGGLDMTHENGPGIARWNRNKRASWAYTLPSLSPTEGSDSESISAVPVSRTAATCDAQVDYYHGTGGRWEPLLERVVVKGDREIVKRTPARGREAWTFGVDGEVDDFIAGNGEGELSSVVRLSCFEEDVKINVTHAALDVVLRAVRDWRALSEIFSADVKGSENKNKVSTVPGTGSGAGSGTTGSAADVGVGGVSLQKQSGGGGGALRYSPFVFQNRTGLQVEFWTHQDKVDSVSRFGRKGFVVEGTSDHPFDMSASSLSASVPDPSSIGMAGAGEASYGGRRRRQHSRHGSLCLLSLKMMGGGDEEGGEPGEGGKAVESPRFLNLPLKETGRRFLQCVLWTEAEASRRLRRCDAVWDVSLENGRHTVVLRSALEVVNRCGVRLEVRCSTDDAFAGRGDPQSRKEEVIGEVAPGGRLPLPLRWCHTEDIRLKPLRRRRPDSEPTPPSVETQRLSGLGEEASQHTPGRLGWDKVGQEVMQREESGGAKEMFEFSDCSALVPAGRAGETNQGVTMSVIPWVACHPSPPVPADSTNDPGSRQRPQPTDSDHYDDGSPPPALPPLSPVATSKPLFLFMEGVESKDGDAKSLRGFAPTEKTAKDPSLASSPAAAGTNWRSGGSSGSLPNVAEASVSRALFLRPLEVVVYASLSFRNLLTVGIGWRVLGTRGDPGAQVAQGWLGPGEGVHVLEVNVMSVPPSLSFQVPGFEWTPPRQVSPAEISRPAPSGREKNRSGNSERGRRLSTSTVDGDREGGLGYATGLSLEAVPCRNRAGQTFYLSVEATTPRINSVLVTIFAGFWVRNLSGLPLTLGEPLPSPLTALEMAEEQRDRAQRRSPSPQSPSLWDVMLSPVQSLQHSVVEEVFELRLAVVVRRQGGELSKGYETGWCSAGGSARSPCSQVQLPSDEWQWETAWTVDMSGAVAPNAPGTAGGGWESCPRKLKGGHYGSSCFSASRSFKVSDPVWRRRWYRRRIPRRTRQASPPPTLPQSEPATRAVVDDYKTGLPAADARGGEREGTGGKGAPLLHRRQSSGGNSRSTAAETSVIYQPVTNIVREGSAAGLDGVTLGRDGAPERSAGKGDGARKATRAALCVRVDDSAWSRPLDISLQGAGGPFQIPGGRWPGLKRPASSSPPSTAVATHSQRRGSNTKTGDESSAAGGSPEYAGVWGEGKVGVYELAYDVRVAPAPWNRTRVITLTSRYTVMNRCDCVLVVRQYGSKTSMELEPGESRALHWADVSLEPMLSVSMITRLGGPLMSWSGPVGIGNIGTFPICIRPKPGGAALPADSLSGMPTSRSTSASPTGSSVKSLSSRSPSSPPRGVEPLSVVGANRVLGVEVNIGRRKHVSDDDDNHAVHDKNGGEGHRSSAVQVVFQEEAWGTGDRFPTYRLENHTTSRMFYGQASVPGAGDALPPGRSCLFGWDEPCPVDEREKGVLNLSLMLGPEPLSSAEGKRLAKTLNIRKLGERVLLTTANGRVEVVVEPDGPSKLVRMYMWASPAKDLVTGLFTPRILSPRLSSHRTASPTPTSLSRASGAQMSWSSSTPGHQDNASFSGTPPKTRAAASRSRAGSLHRASSPRLITPRGGKSWVSSPRGHVGEVSPVEGGRAGRKGRKGRAGGAEGEASLALRELHVFCGAVRVSIVDGDFGEMVLGSLERMSMSVAATPTEVDLRFKLGSLQIDSHMPGTPFPVLLQPVKRGHDHGGDKRQKCVQFALVAAPHVKNVTYIKLASLEVEEFDLRLDEGMVRWAQSLADRVLWTLVAERRADEMSTWSLPEEAFCSQAARVETRATRQKSGDAASAGGSPARGVQSGAAHFSGRKFASRYVYLEVFQVSNVRVRLSLQRAQESLENVYVGVKPGQMLLDLMMRMDSAHIKLKSLIVHNATTTRSRLIMTAREHYQRELKQQAFLMLGSLEAFGNPVGLLRGVGQGVQDFVKEPVMGLLKSVEELAPEELMAGMARGAGSLLKHSVGGVANSVSLITGTVGQNLTTLAMDKEYKVTRARRKEARGENRDILDGIGSATESLARGLTDGVSGLYKNPMRGAERDGFAGFAKGMGTGVLGLVVKPVVGVTDAATDVLRGVKGTTDSIARIGVNAPPSQHLRHYALDDGTDSGMDRSSGGWNEGMTQVRPRRALYGPERALRPYSVEDAVAAALLQVTQFRGEEYTAHLDLGQRQARGAMPASKVVVIITRSLVLVILASVGEVVLEERLDRIQVVEKTGEGVLLHLRSSTPAGPGSLPGLPPTPLQQGEGPGLKRRSGRSLTKGIACVDEELKGRLYDLIDSAVKLAARS